MDTTRFATAAQAAGCSPGAQKDVVRRGIEDFGEREQTPEALATWITGLHTDAPHLFPQTAPAPVPPVVPDGLHLSAIERLARSDRTPPAKAAPPLPPADQVQAWATLPALGRLQALRQWQASQA